MMFFFRLYRCVLFCFVFSRYQGELPYGLSIDSMGCEILQKLGEPTKKGNFFFHIYFSFLYSLCFPSNYLGYFLISEIRDVIYTL